MSKKIASPTRWHTTDIQYQCLNGAIVYCHTTYLIYALFYAKLINSGTLALLTLGLWFTISIGMIHGLRQLALVTLVRYLQYGFFLWVIGTTYGMHIASPLWMTISSLISALYVCLSVIHGSIFATTYQLQGQLPSSDDTISPLSTAFITLSLSFLVCAIMFSYSNARDVMTSFIMIFGLVLSLIIFHFHRKLSIETKPIQRTHINFKLIYHQLLQQKHQLLMINLSMTTIILIQVKRMIKLGYPLNDAMQILAIFTLALFLGHGYMKRKVFSDIKSHQPFFYSLVISFACLIITTANFFLPYAWLLKNTFTLILTGLIVGSMTGLHYPYVRQNTESGEIFLRITSLNFASALSILLSIFTMKFLLSFQATMIVLSVALVWQSFKLFTVNARCICAYSITNLCRCFFRLNIIGLERLQALKPPYIVIANHTSYIDVPLIASVIPHKCIFPIYPDLLNWRSIQWFIRTLDIDTFPITHENPLLLKQTLKSIKEGNPCLIFPEGRISSHGHMMKIYQGAAMLIEKSKVPILPIYIEGAEFSFMGRAQSSCKFPRINLYIGQTIDADLMFETQEKSNNRIYKSNQIADQLLRCYLTQNSDSHVCHAINQRCYQLKQDILIEDEYGARFNHKQIFGHANRLTAYLKNFTTPKEPWIICLNHDVLRTCCYLAALSLNQPILEHEHETLEVLLKYLAKNHSTATIILPPINQSSPLNEDTYQWLQNSAFNIIHLPSILHEPNKNNQLNIIATTSDNPQQTAILTTQQDDHDGSFVFYAYSHEQILDNIKAFQTINHIGRDEKLYNRFPIGHSFQSIIATLTPVLLGAPMFLSSPKRSNTQSREHLYDYEPTILLADTTYIEECCRSSHSYTLYSLKQAVFPAGILDQETELIWKKKFTSLWACFLTHPACPWIASNAPQNHTYASLGRLSCALNIEIQNKSLQIQGNTVAERVDITQLPTSIKPTQTLIWDPSNISIDSDHHLFVFDSVEDNDK